MIGAGIYASSDVAVACTGSFSFFDSPDCCEGSGEAFIRHSSAARVAFAMELGKMSVGDAVQAALARMDPGDGGIIAVDADGNTALEFTTGGMFRGKITSDDTEPMVAIF